MSNINQIQDTVCNDLNELFALETYSMSFLPIIKIDNELFLQDIHVQVINFKL